jgi:hypothetical protein
MDLDSAQKGKGVPTCNTCGGWGHFAKVCPSRLASGYEAQVEDIEEGEEVTSNNEAGKRGA